MVKEKHKSIVNIYNFVRKTVYPSGIAVKEELETLLYEIEEVKKYGLPATYALKYDALMDKNYILVLKNNLDINDEIGCWLEIDESLAIKSKVNWKGKTPVDNHVNKGYLLAYTIEERIKMLDVYMEDFKEIFGYYPKSVGSWVIDIVSLKYLKENYNIEAAVICRDQIGTDGFTLWGGYYNQAYYPSILNEFIPAQNKEMQLDLPIFRLLGSDPIYAFEDGIRSSVDGVYTLEPAATIAQNQDWIKWFFDRQIKESTIGFSYTQTGQENTFLWNTMEKGYLLQMDYIKRLESENLIRVETLLETARWYKRKYSLTATTTIAASDDWNKEEDLKTLWYNSRFYRVSFLFEKGILTIRDLHLFNENYKSRYLENILIEEESVFDSLPFLNSHKFSKVNKRAKISFLQENKNNNLKEIKVEKIKFSKLNENKYEISLRNFLLGQKNNIKEELKIICNENSIEIILNSKNNLLKKEKPDDKKIILAINILPTIKMIEKNKIVLNHNNFEFSIFCDKGTIEKINNYDLSIKSQEGKIILRFSEEKIINEIDFLTEDYKKNKEEIDEYTPNYKRNNLSVNYKKRALKPEIIPVVSVKEKNEEEIFIIENKNNLGEIYYTLDGSEPNKNSFLYKEPIILKKECKIKAKIISEELKESFVAEGNLYQGIKIVDIKALTKPVSARKYNLNGVKTLIDRVKGTNDYRDGSYLGYQEDLDVIVDLGSVIEINKIEIGFLQDTRAWIYYPKDILIQSSIDNFNFKEIEYINCDKKLERKEIALENITIVRKTKTRYIRVFARNQRICPHWSITYGEGPTFLFIDQILVN